MGSPPVGRPIATAFWSVTTVGQMPPSEVSAVHGSRRVFIALAALVVVVTMSSACTRQADPTGYSMSHVGVHFIAGCEKGFVPPGKKEDPSAKQHEKFCGCLYGELSHKTTGIPFKTFASVQSKIRADPTKPANSPAKLIPNYAKYVAKCPGGQPEGPAAP